MTLTIGSIIAAVAIWLVLMLTALALIHGASKARTDRIGGIPETRVKHFLSSRKSTGRFC